MKPKDGLPCGVRLTAGLGGAGGTTALALAAEILAEPERRDTLSIGVVFTTGSVPELSLFAVQTWRARMELHFRLSVCSKQAWNNADVTRHI